MQRFRKVTTLLSAALFATSLCAAQPTLTPVALPYTMTTVAGLSPMSSTVGTQCPNLPAGVKSTSAYGDGCLAVNAILGTAARGGTAVDAFGNVFISDDVNKVVHMINATTGIMTLVAGGGTACSGKQDSLGDGCVSTATTLNGSRGISVDPYGNVILSGYTDNIVHIICRVASPLCGSATPTNANPIQVAIGNMGIVAGCAASLTSSGTGASGVDGTPGFSTKTNTLSSFTNSGTCSSSLGELTQSRGATADQYGNVYYAETPSYRFRVVLGPLTSTYFSGNNPLYAALETHYLSGNVHAGFVYTVVDIGGTSAPASTAPTTQGTTCSETANSVTNQGLATDTYGDGCPFSFSSVSTASTSNVQGLAVDGAGNLIFTDPGHGLRVFVVSTLGSAGLLMKTAIAANNNNAVATAGFVYMLAGGGSSGGVSTTPFLGNTRNALDTSIFKVAVSPQGNIYVGDSTRVLFYDIYTGYLRILFAQGAANVAAGTACTAPSAQKSLSAFSDGCAATNALFGNSNGVGLSVDSRGNLYTLDTASASVLVRKVLAQGMTAQTMRSTLVQNFQVHVYGTSSTSSLATSGSPDITAGTPTCVLNGDNSVDCTFTATSTPSAAGLRSGEVTITNTSNGTSSFNVNLESLVSGSVLAFDNAATTANSTTTPVAPTKNSIFSSITPSGVAVDGAGNVYAASGTSIVESIGGNPFTLTPALSITPSQIAVDQAGGIYSVASGTPSIQRLTLVTAGTPGTYRTDVIPYTPCASCTAAPQAIATSEGAIYVADDQSAGNGGSSIYRLALVGGQVVSQLTVATGLGNPVSLAVDSAGNVFVADQTAGAVYQYTPSVAGSNYSYTQSTKISSIIPTGIAVDAAGNLYVQDSRAGTVTEIPLTGSSTTVLTGLQSPNGLAVDGAGNLYSSDSGNSSITQVVRTAASLGSTSTVLTSITGTLTNVGTLAAAGITQSGSPSDFTLTPTGCTIGTSSAIAPGTACAISASLSGTATQGTGYSDTLSFLASATTIGSVTFSEQSPAAVATPTTTSVTGPSSALYAATGTEITFTVAVTGIASPSGTSVNVTVSSVTTSGTVVVSTSTPTLNSSGQAAVILSGLAAGNYTIAASYAGVANTYAASSGQASFTINNFVATGDTRTVAEPAFPATCTVLSAALTTVNDDIPTSVDASNSNPDGARIQAALNSCSGTGHSVELSTDGAGHNAFLSGPLVMPSNVTLLVDPGVVLYFSRNVQDFDKVAGTHTCGTVNSSSATSSCHPLIEIPNGSTNVGIMGYGKLDGRGGGTLLNAISPYGGQSWWGLSAIANSGGNQQNPRFLQLDSGSSNITLYKITLRNSPLFHISTTGAVTGFTAWDIKIVTPTNSRNTDGIDPGNATNFTITRSWISDGDDNIAVGGSGTNSPASNISVTYNHFFAGHGSSIGSYTSAGISNVLFDGNMSSGNGTAGQGSSLNNTADSNSTGIRIKSGYDRGGVVSNVQYSNSCFQYHKAEIVYSPNYENTTGTSSPNFKNILMQNLTFLTEGTYQFTGTNNSGTILPLQVTLDNVSFAAAQASDFSTAPTNSALTYGPGAVSSNFINAWANFAGANGNSVTNNITETALVPPTCKFTYIAPELTGPNGLAQTITQGQNATAVVILTPAVGGAAYPTGTVTLTDALTSATTTVTLTGTGDTTFIPLTGLSTGTHSFTASYSGDANYPAIGGSPYTTTSAYVITVNAGSLASTSTTLSGVPSSVPFGTSFTATANVTGGGSGTVEFIVNGSAYTTSTLSSGSASATISLPYSASSYSIYAVYSGDSANAGSTSATASLTVNPAITSTGLSASTTTTTLGHPVLLTATVSSAAGTPTGTVSFSYTTTGNSTPVSLGSSTLSGGSAAASAELPQGVDSATATYAGSSGFAGSASSPLSITINFPAIIPLPNNPVALPYTITTIAGGSTASNANTTCAGSTDSFGDGCQATSIVFTSGDDMRSVAADAFGNVFVTDKSAKLVRKIAPNGVISNFAGKVSGTTCIPTSSTGCTPTLVAINNPRGISIDGQGNLYVADYGGNNVYKVSASTGLMYLVAGVGTAGATVNGSLATSTNVNAPRGVWADTVGNVYIANTSGNNILVVDPAGYIHIFAGTGTAASNGDGASALSAAINNPQGVLTDANLNVYISDSSGGKIRVVCVTCGTGSPLDALLSKFGINSPVNGNIYTIAGGGSTVAPTTPTLGTSVTMSPQKLVMDASSNIYVSDSNAVVWFLDFHTGYIRAIAKSGTICGSATDAVGDGCPATQSIFGASSNGLGVGNDALGNIYITETTDLLVRKVSTGLASPATTDGATTTQSVNIHYIAGDTPASSNALAYASPEWTLGTPACTTNADNSTDCLLTSSFTPAAAGARSTPLTVTSSLGNTAALALTGTGVGSGATLDPATQITFGASLQVAGLAADTSGNVYVSDGNSKQVLRFAAASLSQGASAPSTSLGTFSAPGAIAVDPRGFVYVADTAAATVTQIAPSGAASTLPLTLTTPSALAVDSLNNLYVADSAAALIYQVNPITGASRTLSAGGLVNPTGLSIDPKGNLLITDPGVPAIYRLNLQNFARTTVSTSATHPSSALADAAGNLLIADTAAILAQPASSNSAAFTVLPAAPLSLALDSAGNLYTGSGSAVVKLNRSRGSLQFAAASAPQSAFLMESGNQALTLGSIPQTDSTDYSLSATASSDCTISSGLPSAIATGGVCALSASYTPTTFAPTTDAVTFTASTQLTLTGPASAPASSILLNAFNPSSPATGQSVTASATVTGTTLSPTGTVTFSVDGSPVNTPASLVSGTATTSLTGLSAGSHSVSATYNSTNGYATSSTGPVTLVVAATVTIQTVPAGLLVSVDGATAQAAPFSLPLTQGSHTIAVGSPQAGAAGTRYVFTSWSDSGAASHSINVTTDATFTATFKTQYLLTTAVLPAGAGSVAANPTSADGYYDSGTPVLLTASGNAGYGFNSWGGTASGASNPLSVSMTQPTSETANFISTLAPAVGISVASTGVSGSKTFTMTLKNTGGDASNVAASFVSKVTVGTGSVTVSGTPPSTIAGGTSASFPLTVTITGAVTQFTLTTTVTVQGTNGVTYTSSSASKLTP